MNHVPLCPCGDLSCRQLNVVHTQIDASYTTLQKVARSIAKDDLLADDLLQQFCTNIVSRPHNFTPNSSFIALGRVSIQRLHYNTFRNKRVLSPANSQDSVRLTRVIERGGVAEQEGDEGSYKDVELRDLMTAMCNALGNETEKRVFMMLYLGHSGREIAERLEMNVNTIHGMIRRIRGRILDQFGDCLAS